MEVKLLELKADLSRVFIMLKSKHGDTLLNYSDIREGIFFDTNLNMLVLAHKDDRDNKTCYRYIPTQNISSIEIKGAFSWKSVTISFD